MVLLLRLPLHPPPLCWDYRYIWLCLALFLFDVSIRTFKFRRSCFCSKQSYPLYYLSSLTLKFLFHDGGDYYLFLTLHIQFSFYVSPTLTPFLFSFSDMESRESRLFLNFWAQVIFGSQGSEVENLQECMCAICVLSAYEG